MPIEDLGLSVRTYNCLKRSGITKVGQVLQMDRKELLSVRNFGLKSYEELQDSLISRGLLDSASATTCRRWTKKSWPPPRRTPTTSCTWTRCSTPTKSCRSWTPA